MTGIPAVYLLLGICVVTVAGLAAGYGAQRLARLAGILFPLYQTFRALELGDEDDLERRLLWLRYWVVFAVLQCASLPFDFILGGTVPYYFMGKTLLTIALFFPSHSVSGEWSSSFCLDFNHGDVFFRPSRSYIQEFFSLFCPIMTSSLPRRSSQPKLRLPLFRRK